MRCRLHPCEAGRGGVCTSCLKERLEALVAERKRHRRAPSSSPSPSPPSSSPERRSSATETTTASCPEFSLPFPRSVSPYVAVRDRDSLFFSTPQLNPNEKKRSKKKNHYQNPDPDLNSDSVPTKEKRFSIFSALFRRREKPRDGHARVISSTSWFSSFLPVRHKNSRLFPAGVSRTTCRPRDRGMSPAADDEAADEGDYFSDTPGIRRTPEATMKTPTTTAVTIPAARRWTVQHNPSGFAFCLSPLMRPIPTRCCQEQVCRDRSPLSGEIRASHLGKHLFDNPRSFRSRSRKFSDSGKFP